MSNKGFSLNSENEAAPSRLPKFQSPALDFDETPLNYQLWSAAHSDPAESKTPRFVVLSSVLHAALLSSVMLLSPLFETPKAETITIEIADDSPAPIPRGSQVAETLGEKAPVAPSAAAPREEIAAGDVVVPAAKMKPAKSAARKATKAPSARTAPRAAKTTAVAAVKPVVAESPVEVPEEINKLDAPELDENQFDAAVAPEFNEGELDRTFAKVDHANEKGLKALTEEISQDADSLSQEQDSALDEMDRENREEAQRLAAKADALKQKNAALIAQARAQEGAAREAAARAAAARKAAQQGQGQNGPGAGARGQAVTGLAAGSPQGGGVRDISQLRQMPGNPRPSYNSQERYKGHQGEVVYLAYITKSGLPTEFRQLRSTGYANLDEKTLAALRKWKFYPGQEGWVQIPFKWDLKGGAQETSALARRVSAK